MSDSDGESQSLVIDNGSGLIKAGFAGDKTVSAVFPTAIGTYSTLDSDDVTGTKHVFGDKIRSGDINQYEFIYPMEHGIVTNWDQMELLWHHMFYQELRVKPEEYPCLMTEPALNPKLNREKMAQVMFESFGVPAFFVCMQGILACYSSGRGTAIVINSGDTVTDVLVIYEGHSFPHAMDRAELGGRDLTSYLAGLLRQKGHAFETTSERDIVRKIKEKHCYISLDIDKDMYDVRMNRKLEKHYELPDGTIIAISEERFQCPEAMFNPSLIGSDEPGLPEFIHQSLRNCDIDTRRDLYANVVISGGNTMFPGMSERLQTELSSLIPGGGTNKIKVVAPPERRSSVWIGGSILASLSTFQDLWVTKQQYEEYGPTFIHRKCL